VSKTISVTIFKENIMRISTSVLVSMLCLLASGMNTPTVQAQACGWESSSDLSGESISTFWSNGQTYYQRQTGTDANFCYVKAEILDDNVRHQG
jgi:hypothetical protein